MLRNKTVAVIGGDMRQLAIYEQLTRQNNKTALCAFEKYNFQRDITSVPVSAASLSNAEIIILPLPSFINDCLNAKFSDTVISSEELAYLFPKGSKVFGGKLGSGFMQLCEKLDIHAFDYMKREEFAVLNAVPTAEGAIALAIENTEKTLLHSRVLICGFGRIGKVCAQRLSLLGAKVFVSARKPADLAWISAYGMTPLKTGELCHTDMDFDLIINTVPHMIFDKKLLSRIGNGCVIIDLASLPGGVDFDSAAAMGLRAIQALSLPGKIAPVSAGKTILATVENILDESEV